MWFQHKPFACIFLLAMALISQKAFSQNSFTFNSQFVESAFYKNNELGMEGDKSFSSVSYGNNFSFVGDWNAFCGIRLGDETKELSASLDFWPEFCNFKDSGFSFGYKTIYHYLDYGRWCIENDIVLEPFVKYSGRHDWFIKASMGIGFKEQKIKVLKQWLHDDYLVMDIEMNKRFFGCLEAYLLASNHDNYRFYLFPSPLYTFGAAWTFSDRYRIYANWQFHCCDMFTTKFFLNGEQLSGGIRIYL